MSIRNKRALSTLVYYTLAIMTFLLSAFFVYALMVKDVVIWARVIYFIWIGLVIGVVIFDIICTRNKEAKTISGLIIYVLSVLAVIMAVLLYAMNSGATGLATSFFNLFISISIISLMTTGLMIATWCVGEHMVEHQTVEDEMEGE
ncbi:MAG: hypothetical protein E7351_00295 [Clostridiales bacterium]|nr:hypothetical protein [Clostridiales bacterium]